MKNNYLIIGFIIILIAIGAYYSGKNSNNLTTTNIETGPSNQSLTEAKDVTDSTKVTELAQTSQNTEILQSQCAQLCLTAQNGYYARFPDRSEYNIMDSTFHYNARLHECLWGKNVIFTSDHGQPFTTWKGITNLYSNKDILYAINFYSGDNIPKLTQPFGAINYIDYSNEEGGGVIKDESIFDALYIESLTE